MYWRHRPNLYIINLQLNKCSVIGLLCKPTGGDYEISPEGIKISMFSAFTFYFYIYFQIAAYYHPPIYSWQKRKTAEDCAQWRAEFLGIHNKPTCNNQYIHTNN